MQYVSRDNIRACISLISTQQYHSTDKVDLFIPPNSMLYSLLSFLFRLRTSQSAWRRRALPLLN